MIWAFDVDGTLVGSIVNTRLRPGATELLADLAGRGVTCVLWSAGGRDYAQRVASAHGIDGCFVGFYGKELRDDNGRYRVDHLDHAHRPDAFVDDSPIDMPNGAYVVAVAQFIGNNPADRGLHAVLDELDRHMLALQP